MSILIREVSKIETKLSEIHFSIRPHIFEWNSTFFAFSFIIGGTAEKVLQFIMPLKSIYNKNLGLVEKKCIFELYGDVQASINLLIDNIFAMTKNFW